MSRKYFLSPASKKNNKGPYDRLQKTVRHGLSPEHVSQHTKVQVSNPVRIWGLREGQRSLWNRMTRGDVILFYTGGEYEYAAQIWTTEYNEELAKKIFGILKQSLGGDLSGDFEPWPYLLFLRKLRKLSLPSAKLHNLLGYENNYVVGTQRVTQARERRMAMEYGSMAKLIVDHTEEKYF